MAQSPYFRFRLIVFACFVLAAPWVVVGAREALRNAGTSVEEWLPDSFEETQKLQWFAEHFVADDLLLISWEGCTLEDKRLQRLKTELSQPIQLPSGGEATVFRKLISGRDALDQLMAEPLNMPEAAAKTRLQGWLLGPENDQTCLLALMSPDGLKNRSLWFAHLYASADRVPGLERDQIRFAGTTRDAEEIDRASTHLLMEMSVASQALCFVLMLVLFRDVILAACLFINALFCQQLSLALVTYSGLQMDSVMLMVPSLVYVLTVSAGVHIINYYRDASHELGSDGAPLRAVKDALAPCVLAASTTAVGLSSLAISFLTPVRKFGICASASLLIANVVLFTLLPCQLEQIALWKRKRKAAAASNPQTNSWRWLLSIVDKGKYVIHVLAIAVLIFSGWGITRIRSSAGVHSLLPADAAILQDYEWVEDRIGPLIPVEIVLRVPLAPQPATGSRGKFIDRLRLVAQVHGKVAQLDDVGVVVSPLNFLPRIPPSGETVRQIAKQVVLNRKLEANADALVEAAMLRHNGTEELWRISVRAYAGKRHNYVNLLNEIETAVGPVVKGADALGLKDVSAVFCGGVPLVQKVQDQMLVDLINSFVTAFGIITVMMILLMIGFARGHLRQASRRSDRMRIVLARTFAGVVSMIPNLIPCVLVLGGMGLAGIPLDIGSIMTAGVALGIAVDDTLHFITWFCRGLQDGRSRSEAVEYAYSRCASAMTQTSLICGLGLLVYGFSDFVPIARFAWLMFAMLFAAVLADLIILPAVLLGPLGKLFHYPQNCESR